MTNYYHILGLDMDATHEEIRQAYRKLSMKFHPDKNQDDKYFEEWTKKVNGAYETLGNPSNKALYDHALALEMQRREYIAPEVDTDSQEVLLLKEIRSQLPEYYDAKYILGQAREKYNDVSAQEYPVIITTGKAILCTVGIAVAIVGLWYALLR